jgi:hypothetical protein
MHPALLLAAFFPGSEQAPVASSPPTAAQCEIARAYIEGLLIEARWRRSVFSLEPVVPFIPDQYPQHWGSLDGLSAAPPAPPGLAEALPVGSNAVRSCASIRRLLTRQGVRFGWRAVTWASHVRRGRWDHYRARIVRVSLPAVSADGAHAVLVRVNSRGGLDGGEGWYHIERGTDGRWRTTSASALWVA